MLRPRLLYLKITLRHIYTEEDTKWNVKAEMTSALNRWRHSFVFFRKENKLYMYLLQKKLLCVQTEKNKTESFTCGRYDYLAYYYTFIETKVNWSRTFVGWNAASLLIIKQQAIIHYLYICTLPWSYSCHYVNLIIVLNILLWELFLAVYTYKVYFWIIIITYVLGTILRRSPLSTMKNRPKVVFPRTCANCVGQKMLSLRHRHIEEVPRQFRVSLR
jgi:hypothetical protein